MSNETHGESPAGQPQASGIRALGQPYPPRTVPRLIPSGVDVDIVDRLPEGTGEDPAQGGQSIHVGADVYLNGKPVYIPVESKIFVESGGCDGTKVTIVFFARRVRIGNEYNLAQGFAESGGPRP